jgi:hyaluronoglucosaminidase
MTELGIIEGYYGKPWTWEERAATMSFLAGHDYRFYMYAPKADIHLRRKWRSPHPVETADAIRALSRACRDKGVRFGVGLSPIRIHLDFSAAAKETLVRKLDEIAAFGVDDFALLFDDMRGDLPDLARRQLEIIDFVAPRISADRFIVCPSYYSDDPILDRVFGDRPDGYLEQLGRSLDPSIHIFWTGPEVLSRHYPSAHLERVSNQLQRKPFIWDNYPVNDGERMSRHLHVRGFTGRPSSMGGYIAAHGVNPALQPVLSRIPALTLVDSYRQQDAYDYSVSFRNAAVTVLGAEVGTMVYEDMLFLQEFGNDRLGAREQMLRDRYAAIDHPAAREIIAWLDGEYAITDEIVKHQSGDDE